MVSMIMIVVPVPIVPAIPVVMIIPMTVIALFVARFVFLRSDEIHRTIASVVFATVLAPIFCVPRRNVQIDRRRRGGLRLDDHRLRVHERRRTRVSDSHLTVNAGGYFAR
jgi:hypothetical protein